MTKSKKYIEGVTAFNNQVSQKENPYDVNKAGASRVAFYDWESGWVDTMKATTSYTTSSLNFDKGFHRIQDIDVKLTLQQQKEAYADRLKSRYESTKKALLVLGLDDFVNVTESMYVEYKEKDGLISCDNSTKGLHLDLKMKFLSLMSMIDPDSIGYWRIYWCGTCEDHNADHPYHCEIVRDK